MVDQHAEIIRVLALMGLAEDWHVEPNPNGMPDMVILRGRRVSVSVSFLYLDDNPARTYRAAGSDELTIIQNIVNTFCWVSNPPSFWKCFAIMSQPGHIDLTYALGPRNFCELVLAGSQV